MKLPFDSKYSLYIFLFTLFVINLIQGYFTELIADEAYYWTYSNYLSWGYFDHPPMVAVWISISKLFFPSGELSVRFFSSITLPITFYLIWLLIDHPKKRDYIKLFILLVLSTSLFNAYGFITVPDTPLLFFVALFLLGYKKYLKDQHIWSYLILALAMAGMLYSKYQAVLVIFFVLLSNLKVVRDWKIWLMSLVTLALFFPHLYWQFENDFPSFKYHLFERKENTEYKFRDTYMHIINMIVIFGFTFPIVYTSLIKNLKNKDLFQRALNFLAIGFIVFFFISTFKGHAQAQWIVPISIPLIIIPFYYLIENPKKVKRFTYLAVITIALTTYLRFAMVHDNLLPIQFEMHGNKKWVNALDQKLNDEAPLFLNSYQNTSLYWFYTGKRPYQYNSWSSRKNQYDLYDFNTNYNIDNTTLIGVWKRNNPSDSIPKRNRKKIFIKKLSNSYKKITKDNIHFELINPKVKENTNNIIPVKYHITSKEDMEKLNLIVTLKSGGRRILCNAALHGDTISFFVPKLKKDFRPNEIQLVGSTNNETIPVRLSSIEKCDFIYE